jgi:coenzyme F420 hydrogenase subunit beta
VLHSAAAAGYLVLETCDATLLPRSQPNLLETRGSLFGRLLALRVAGAAVPRFERFSSRRFWWSELTPKRKFQSVFGTLARVGRKRLARRVDVAFGATSPDSVGGDRHANATRSAQ